MKPRRLSKAIKILLILLGLLFPLLVLCSFTQADSTPRAWMMLGVVYGYMTLFVIFTMRQWNRDE